MLIFQQDSAESGLLDGTTIVRFTHATSSMAGTETHIDSLNSALLQRNRMKIIYLYLSEKKDAASTETKSGRGSVITIPLQLRKQPERNRNNTYLRSFSRRIVNSNLYHLAKERMLELFVSFQLLTYIIQKQKRSQQNLLAADVSSIAKEIFSKYKIDLLVNHYAGESDSLEIMNQAVSCNTPILIINHFSNKRFYRPGIKGQLRYAHTIAGLSTVDVPPYIRKRYVNVSNGIDTDFFTPEIYPDPLHFSERPFILLPARVIKSKGHIDLLKTALELRRDHLECILVFAGKISSADYKQELDSFIAQNDFQNNVIFTGMINQSALREWYRKSKLVVLPTYHQEGLPRVLLEAQAMMVPPLSYNRGGVSEAIVQNETGFFFKCGDRRSMLKKISSLLSDEQRRVQIGKNGRNFIRSNFSLPLLAQRHESLYFQIIRSQHSGNEPLLQAL